MGWLGWAPDHAMESHVELITLAIDGRLEMLRMIFGSTDDDGDDKSKTASPVTADTFRDIAKRINSKPGNRPPRSRAAKPKVKRHGK